MTPNTLTDLLAAVSGILLLILFRVWMHARSLQRDLDEAEKRYWLKWGRRDFYGELPSPEKEAGNKGE